MKQNSPIGKTSQRGLYWLRSDLRTIDNRALSAFCDSAKEGLIVWTPTPSYLRAQGARKIFIDQTLHALNDKLAQKGLSILTLKKPMSICAEELITEFSIDQIYFSKLDAPEELSEEKKVSEIALKHKVKLSSFSQSTLIPLEQLPFSINNLPLIFTEFRKKVEYAMSAGDILIEAPVPEPHSWPSQLNLKVTADYTDQQAEAETQKQIVFEAGEEPAHKRLAYYFFESKKVLSYKETRNGFDQDDSTRFSPYLAIGSLTANQIYQQLKNFEEAVGANDSTYWVFFELLWRDYFKFLALRFGSQIYKLEGLPIGSNKKSGSKEVPDVLLFEDWKNGKTSEPFINANMLELKHTGWMSNRGRQNVASYLVHSLKQPWVWGAKYFEAVLIDYDPESNWGNWLYVSGRGTDPRAREFNIKRQAEMYDPHRDYQKKWVKDL